MVQPFVYAQFLNETCFTFQSTSCTVKCLLNTVTSFPALVRRISESMIERILSATTHSPMPPAEKSKTNADLVSFTQEQYCCLNCSAFLYYVESLSCLPYKMFNYS